MASVYPIEKIKGIHPGLFLDRELKKRNIPKGVFALSIGEYPQTLGGVTLGKRRMNIALALKVEKALGYEEGYFSLLQVYHDIRELKKKEPKPTPDLSKLSPILFWDTRFDLIDWELNKKAVVRRVFEMGSPEEKEEIRRFYGREQVSTILAHLPDNNPLIPVPRE